MNSTDPYWVLSQMVGDTREAFMENCKRAGIAVTIIEKDRGDGRKIHYGEGKQPWDTCKELGWAAQGAAFSILRYLRRTKTPERDLREAKVYFGWLKELAAEHKHVKNDSMIVLNQLLEELSPEEFERLNS